MNDSKNFTPKKSIVSNFRKKHPDRFDYTNSPQRHLLYRKNRSSIDDLKLLVQNCSESLKNSSSLSQSDFKQLLYLRCMTYQKLNENEKAIDDLNELVQIDPTHPKLYFKRGLIYHKMKKIHEAIDDFSKCLEIEPNHIQAFYNRAACLNEINNFEMAITDYENALKKDTPLKTRDREMKKKDRKFFGSQKKNLVIDIDIVKGQTGDVGSSNVSISPKKKSSSPKKKLSPTKLLKNILSNKEKRIAFFTRAIIGFKKKLQNKKTHNNDEYKTYYNIAYCFDKLENFKEAIIFYSKSIDLSKNSYHGYYNRGICLDKLEEFEAAISDFSAAIKILSENSNDMLLSDVYHSRGFSYRKISNYSAAVNDYSAAIFYNKNNFKAFFNRGYIYELQNELKLAINDYSIVINICSDNSDVSTHAYYNRACCFMKMENYSAAISDFNKTIQSNEKMDLAWNLRGVCYEKCGDFKNALKNFEKAVNINPKNFDFFYNIGITLKRLNDFKNSIKFLSKSIKLFFATISADDVAEKKFHVSSKISQTSLEDMYYNRGFGFRKIGQLQHAVDDYNKVLKINPKNLKVLKHRAFTFAKMKLYIASINDYSKVIEIDSKDVHALSNRAQLFKLLNEDELAKNDFKRIFEIEKNKKSK